MQPTALLALGLGAHGRFVQTVDHLEDARFRLPGLLPGWSRADVIAWVALKSQSHVRLFEGAALAEVRSQFPDGYDQPTMVRREASHGAGHLRAILTSSFADLEKAWHRLPDPHWASEGDTTAGRRSMTDVLARHLRDVEVHHVDLDLGYRPSDWPAEFVELELAKRLRDLERRAEPAELLAWLLGRLPAPQLGPW